jgi:type II secretory pathway pseudopilin PulG
VRKLSGFALMEVAIAVCVMGVVTSVVVPMVRSMFAYARAVQSRHSMEHVMRALAVYVKLYDRLPWAANDSNGVEEESIAVGRVPFKTLSIEQECTKDGSKNDLVYIVNPKLTYWVPSSPLNKGSAFLQFAPNDNLRVLLEDESEAIAFDQESMDFCAVVLVSLPSKLSLGNVVQADGDHIVVKIPYKSSGVSVRWISRGNLSVLCN